MTTKPDNPTSLPQLTSFTAHITLAGPCDGDRVFEMHFTSTPRGARLARRLTAVRLDAWGIAYGTEPHDEIVLIVAELTANAVRHGHVPGSDFHLRVHAPADGRTVRTEVTDTRADQLPRCPVAPDTPGTEEETGRGLLLVARLAARWDWHPRSGGPGKTIWAEYALRDEPGSPSCP
ncbi:ATP-binding protein [Streptomyces sp. NPDC006012]|uniref:ATP-binding protein n=1 Tax=Streptomyces sp. NPDC006012 TaxID=3364739 RepID=UPI0036AAAACB